MNTPINFEVAKLLKEKGFDDESAHYYTKEGEQRYDSAFPSLQPTKYFEYYDAPTIAEVVMWLYEQYEIWITVELYYNPHKIDKKFFEFGISDIKSGEEGLLKNASNRLNNDWLENPKEYNLCDTPTEAYEAAIEYTLINLIK